jgi:hypothetical protein
MPGTNRPKSLAPFDPSYPPISNVLKLDEGKPTISTNEPQTYGANIYDLLTDSFFLKNYYIGEHARKEIQKLINTLQLENEDIDGPILKENEEMIRLRIEMIGEDFLKRKLFNMFYEKYPESRKLRRIKLENELKLLEEDDSDK